MQKTALPASGLSPSPVNRKRKWLACGRLILLTIWSIYLFIFIEWLFYATKPSFMDLMPLGARLEILFVSGLVPVLISLPLLAVLCALSFVPWWSPYWKTILLTGGVLPAFFLAAAALMLVDNFTYTVFKFGIISTQGFERGLYGLVFLLILIGSLRWVIRILARQDRKRRVSRAMRAQLVGCAVLLVPSFFMVANAYGSGRTTAAIPVTSTNASRPNILLIGSDSMNADRMSLYGYGRDTTPFLKTLVPQSLLAENNFPNANETAGSLISLFTGKLPTATRVLYPPDILQGGDTFQHLPGILKSKGYYNAEISVDYYGDMTVMNLQDGFDQVNGHSTAAPTSPIYTLVRRFVPDNSNYFLNSIAGGLSDRLGQIYYLRTMTDPYAEVTQPNTDMNDQPRVDAVLNLFQTVQQPLFIHVYMMGTHLNGYDKYDDAVQAFDGYMKQVVDGLAKLGKLDQTIIIFYTDNGFGDVSNTRIPLMIRFPNGAHAGTLTHNTQNLDIGPTVLDYLGIKQPAWMGGSSLLKGEPPANRPIFSAAPNYLMGNAANELQLDPSKIYPPFYQFGTVGMVVCQKWYGVDTGKLAWQEGDVAGYTNPCGAGSLPTDSQAQQMILNHMKSTGFDIRALSSALGQGK
ncbi:MAG TPA: sulfatase-like hydrolase/transferase [Anaerolineaceae bacterium]